MNDAWLWWLFIQMLGLACLPLTFSVFANLPDRGWALAKALGVLSACFLVWFPLTLPLVLPGALSGLALPYARGTILACLLLLLAINGWLLRYRWREIARFARQHTAYLLLCEALFAGAFALLIWIRAFIPDVYGTEKFMDEAFVAAIMRSPHLPPNDPWLSGYTLNYYYLGHFIVATLAKLLGTAPAVAFNTGIALIFALMAVNLFGVTSNVVALLRFHRQRRAGEAGRLDLLAAAPFGLAAVLLSLVFGNLAGASDWLAQLGTALSFNSGLLNVLALVLTGACVYGLVWCLLPLIRSWRQSGASGLSWLRLVGALAFGLAALVLLPWLVSRTAGIGGWLGAAWPRISNWLGHPRLWAAYDWWAPSRAVRSSPAGYVNITEFPAFSFLLADLHAHVLALPFTVLALGFALSLLLARGRGLVAFGATSGWRALTLVSGAVIIGGLYAINGWDIPTYAGLALLCLAVQQWRAYGSRFSKPLVLDFLTIALLWLALGLLLYLPFLHAFNSPSQGVGLIPPPVQGANGQLLPGVLLPDDRTSFADFWSVFGVFLAILAAFLFWQLVLALITRWRRAALARLHPTSADLEVADDALAEDEEASEHPVGGVAPGPVEALLPFAFWGLLGAAVALMLLVFVPYSLVLVTCLAGVAACAVLAYRRLMQPGIAFALMLAGTALAVVGTCEVVYLRDVFGGEYFRMNTIFKLYYQAWTLFSVSGAALLHELLGTGWHVSREREAPRLKTPQGGLVADWSPEGASSGAVFSGRLQEASGVLAASEVPGASGEGPLVALPGRRPAIRRQDGGAPGEAALPGSRRDGGALGGASLLTPGLRVLGLSGKLVWTFGFLILVVGALVYPVFAAAARTGNYNRQVGLDGAQYLETLYPGDAAAIRWINAHIDGDPVIVEATGGEYSDFARVSTFTGLPTILGWGGHEYQWRVNWLNNPANAADFNRRSADIDTIYTSPDAGQVLQLLHHYHARYLYVGTLERQKYPKADLGRFASFLQVVYQAGGVSIYKIS
jgi:uncharacterized membrane protein